MQSKQKSELPLGAGKRPEAVTEQRAGYETANDPWTKILFDSSRKRLASSLTPGTKPRPATRQAIASDGS
jgi:hypothetical protein